MPRYRANARVLNLNVGDEFTSDDPYYETFANQGYLTAVEPVDEPAGDDPDSGTDEQPETPQSQTTTRRRGGSRGRTRSTTGAPEGGSDPSD